MTPASSLGRGTLYILVARILFVLCGYSTFLVLGRVLGPELFGIYGVVTSLVFTVSIVLVTSVQQTTSKFVSEQPRKSDSIKYQIFKLQLGIGLASLTVYFFISPLLALIFKDHSLVPYVRYTSLMIVFQSLFFVFVGYLNGLKRFKHQALLSSFNSVLKAGLVITLVLMGYSLFGAITGFILSAVISLAMSILLFKLKPQKNILPLKKIFGFGVPIFFFAMVSVILMNLDLFFVKAVSPMALANTFSGYYTAALTLSRVPYYLITALTITIFPLVSESTYLNQAKRTTKLVAASLKYTVILMTFVVFMISSTAATVTALFYGRDYLPASQPLSILIFGGGLFAIFMLLSTLISASGKPKHTFAIGGITLIVDFFLNYLLVPRYQLLGAAIATTAALLIAVCISGFYIKRRFQVHLPLKKLALVLSIGLFLGAASFKIPTFGFWLIAKYLSFGVVYLGLLYLLGVLGAKDKDLFKKLFLKI